ncbi:MAG: hypothetical protein ACD_54C00585G0005 [uncultured bacterium]|nr:MAG: hypothetical protein ACD_54C00585G0005 [uncultured bacterium]
MAGGAGCVIFIIRNHLAAQVHQPAFASLPDRKHPHAACTNRFKLRRKQPLTIQTKQPPQTALLQRLHAALRGRGGMEGGFGHPTKAAVGSGGAGKAKGEPHSTHGQAQTNGMGAGCEGGSNGATDKRRHGDLLRQRRAIASAAGRRNSKNSGTIFGKNRAGRRGKQRQMRCSYIILRPHRLAARSWS